MSSTVAGHVFEDDRIDSRCTAIHSAAGATERCIMTRSWLWDAPFEDVNKVGTVWTSHGTFLTTEYEQIQKDKDRITKPAWAAVEGVCTS